MLNPILDESKKKDIENEVELTPIAWLPKEILNVTASFLNLYSMVRLRRVNRRFKSVIDDEQYRTFEEMYNRLRIIEPRLDPIFPKKNFLQFYYNAVNDVVDFQRREICHINEFPPNEKAHVRKIVSPKSIYTIPTLLHLEKVSEALDKINIKKIKDSIDINTRILDLSKVNGVTRFPKQLLAMKEYEVYWDRLEVFNITNSLIAHVPLEIDKCKALKKFICEYGNLSFLPATLGNCRGLEVIFCTENPLTEIPETLGNCKSLKKVNFTAAKITRLPEICGNWQLLEYFDCGGNFLTELPASLGNCSMLKELYANGNKISQLPATLSNCKKIERFACSDNRLNQLPDYMGDWDLLVELDCNDNNLESVPESLINRLGRGWADTVLDNQYEEDTDDTKPSTDGSHIDEKGKSATPSVKRKL